MSQALRTTPLCAWNLATTLMVCGIVFKAGDGFGFMPSSEYEGRVALWQMSHRTIRPQGAAGSVSVALTPPRSERPRTRPPP
jgi:hypothetical protein